MSAAVPERRCVCGDPCAEGMLCCPPCYLRRGIENGLRHRVDACPPKCGCSKPPTRDLRRES